MTGSSINLPQDFDALLSRTRAGAASLRAAGFDRILRVLTSLLAAWRSGGTHREAFLASAPERRMGLSRPMVIWALDQFAARIDPAGGLKFAQLHFSGAIPEERGSLRYEPLGSLLVIVSGNVFTGPAEALVAALVTRNAAIVKRPSDGSEFLESFVSSLADAAPDLAGAVAVANWKGGTEWIERPLAEGVDGIIIAGDSDTVAAYRALAPATTPLIEFGPRISLAIASKRGIASLDIDGLARDVALWDQRACSAAQIVYVQGEAAALQTAEALADALTRLERVLPSGEATLDERIEVSRLRNEMTFAEAQNDARVFAVDGGLATVVFERSLEVRPTPLRRTVRVKAYERLEDLERALVPARHLLQTVGLAIDLLERASYEEILLGAGARRLCSIGSMNEFSSLSAHDGTLPLQRLVRWVECIR